MFNSPNQADLARSNLLNLVSDLGFHLETPYVLFSNQTLCGITSALFYNCFEDL